MGYSKLVALLHCSLMIFPTMSLRQSATRSFVSRCILGNFLPSSSSSSYKSLTSYTTRGISISADFHAQKTMASHSRISALRMSTKVEDSVSDTVDDIREEDLFGFDLPTNENSQNLLKARHTTAHIMAMAVQKIYPEAQVTIGPWIDQG